MYAQEVSIAMFALAWFVVGVLTGRQLEQAQSAGSRGKSGRGRSRSRGGGGGDRGTGRGIELYVGNLPYKVRKRELIQMFEEFGDIESCRVIQDKSTGKSKGFGFVEMADRRGAKAATSAMNDKVVRGRKLVVNEAESPSR